MLLAAMCLVPALNLSAQQVQEKRYTHRVLVFPEFRDARITFSFLRKGKARANIFYKDASLIYLQDTVKMQADLSNVLRVDFGDSVSYQTVGKQMGRVVAEKGRNSLVCVTTVDMSEYNTDAEKGKNLPFFELPDFNVFLETEGDFSDDAKQGYPLKDTYYFISMGDPFPATEREFKKHLAAEKKNDFKELMKDRFWSWNDARSLAKLLDYLPQK